MFNRLGHGVARRPVASLISWILLIAIAFGGVFWGYGHQGLFPRLASTDPGIPGTESKRVSDLTTTTGGTTITVAVKGLDLPAEGAKLASALATTRDKLKVSGVASVTDAFTLPNLTIPQAQALLSNKSDGFVEVITLDTGLSEKAEKQANTDVENAVASYTDALRAEFPNIISYVVSPHTIGSSITDLVQKDLVRGETIGLPVALLIMMIVFGGLIAAGLPLIGAIASIVIGMGALWLLTFATDVNSFILNVISIIGLALSIDYGLLIVSRYREELVIGLRNAGLPTDGTQLPGKHVTTTMVHKAVQRTIASAGRTVSFSAVTIAFALASLLMMKSPILKIIAAGGIIVALLAVLTAVTLVPALITLLGRHLIKPSLITRIPGLRLLTKAIGDSSADTGAFSRLAHRVHQHPWLILIAVATMLVALAAPIRGLNLRSSFVEYMPKDSPAQVGYGTLQNDYPVLATPSVIVVANAPLPDTVTLVSHIKSLPNVTFVNPSELGADPNQTKIAVRVNASDQVGPQVTDIVKQLRDYDPGYQMHVGGAAASQIDFNHSLSEGSPWALLIIVLAVTVLLFLMTGSLIVPLKALIINSLSLIASLGATTWIFQGGHFGLHAELGLETFVVACMVAFGFGLAMDYEVFLLARIKEYYDSGMSNDDAVAAGLQRSGRIITSAAAIIVAVFLGFAAGQMVAIREIGVALAITVITDATLVRLLLVPSTMTILGKWNWWSPRFLHKFYERFKIVH